MAYSDKALDRFVLGVSSVKDDLRISDVGVLIKDTKKRDAAARVKAFAIVHLSACLERFVKDVTIALHNELNERCLDLGKVRKTLLSIVHDNRFEALRQTTGLTNWGIRVSLFENIYTLKNNAFRNEITPLDSKTLRKSHFDILWSVYGFSGKSLPSVRHVVALESLADIRNDVAHGNQFATTIGRLQTTNDLLSLTTKIEEIALHLALSIEDYLNRNLYEEPTLI